MKKKSDLVLVGNGPSVKDHEMGELIDSYDTVVRFNWYHIDGYEKYVGTKTDIWFTTIFDPQRAKHPHRLIYEHSWEWNPAGDKCYNQFIKSKVVNYDAFPISKALSSQEKGKPLKRPIKTCMAMCLDMTNYLMTTYGHHKTNQWLPQYECWSTGAIAAWWFLNERRKKYDSDKVTPKCDTIDLYGFDWWNMGDKDYHHYGDAQTVGKNHKPKIELELFNLLYAEGKIHDLHPGSDFHLDHNRYD